MQTFLESLQILRGCIVVDGAIAAAGTPSLALAVDGEILPTSVTWHPRARRPLGSRISDGVKFLAGAGPARRFTLRALGPDGLTGAEAARVAIAVTAAGAVTLVDDLMRGWLERDLGPAMDRLYGRFQREILDRPGARVIELGSRARSGIDRSHDFPTAHYTGFDIKAGPNVDVVGDAHALFRHFGPDSFEFATSVSVFEHLAWPWKVVLELGKVLVPGGLVYTQSHQTWPMHERPWDFFRFSKSAWAALFNEATGFEIVAADDLMEARIVPVHQTGEPSIAVEGETGYLLSACIARKVGPPRVSWDAVPDLSTALGAYPA